VEREGGEEMSEVIDMEKETLVPVTEEYFRDMLSRFGGKSWRVDWATDNNGNILMTAYLDGRRFVGYVTSAFERRGDENENI
jgi:hypothetical protein